MRLGELTSCGVSLEDAFKVGELLNDRTACLEIRRKVLDRLWTLQKSTPCAKIAFAVAKIFAPPMSIIDSKNHISFEEALNLSLDTEI